MKTVQVSQNSEIKKGGPYTKKQQNQRRDQVYDLYFLKGEHIATISEILEVNRNTIANDIRYLNSIMAEDWSSKDFSSWVLTSIERLEEQKRRLMRAKMVCSDLKTMLQIEKMVFAINSKISQIGIDLLKSKKLDSNNNLKEESNYYDEKLQEEVEYNEELYEGAEYDEELYDTKNFAKFMKYYEKI